jgi:hypothetical protein
MFDRPTASSFEHHSSALLVASAPAALAISWLPLGAARPFASLGLLIVIVGAWFALRRHDRTLCERCLCDFPDNPSADAERFHRRLHAVHLVSGRRGALTYLGAIFTAMVLLGSMASPPALATVAYLFLAQRTHRRLQPWCPECANGGTDILETTPSPELTPTA